MSAAQPGPILLTGFEAYGNTPVNPAEQVVRALDGREIGKVRVCGRVIPNTFGKCVDVVKAAIDELKPSLVIMMGEYGGRATISVERLAQNLNDSTRYGLVDNAGVGMQDELTAPDGPAAYRATAPIRAMTLAMRRAGVPAEISDAAGTFCCNHLHYGVLHAMSQRPSPPLVGWLHLPSLPEVAALPANIGTPSMSTETAAKGVVAALEAALAHRDGDVKEAVSGRLQI